MLSRLLRPVLSALLLAVLVLATPAAHAQEDEEQGIFEQAGPLALPFGWRTLSQACKQVGFDGEQLTAVRTLHQGYRSSVRDAMTKARKANEKLRPMMDGENPDWATYQKEQMRVTAEFVKNLDAAEKTLLTDVEAVCTPEQKAKFTLVERARRREQARVFTIAPGETIDPGALLDSLNVARTPEITGALTQWEETTDRILLERERLLRKIMAREVELGPDPEAQQKEMKEAFGEFRDISQRVGDLNRRTAREITALLPADAGAKFEREVRVRTFPRIWGESKVTRAVKVAKARQDISAEQKQKLDDVLAAYHAEAEPVNLRWAAAADDKFRTLTADFLESMGIGEARDENEPFFAIRKERRSLDDKYALKVEAVLNDDQLGEVTKAEKKYTEENEGREFIPEFLPDLGKDFEDKVAEWKGEEEP
ncbi:MAG TPA: hypothetical protein VD997_03650 [Phycisphaerales bacterium]|nr:hypothetical protein [Phycisphaerales bacterium]